MTQPEPERPAEPASARVAFVLAIGIAAALNLITAALLVAAFMVPEPELSANATQLLTGWGGGIIGVLGSYIGFQFGQRGAPSKQAPQSIKRPAPAPQAPQSIKGTPP